jgi:hypothetical protein
MMLPPLPFTREGIHPHPRRRRRRRPTLLPPVLLSEKRSLDNSSIAVILAVDPLPSTRWTIAVLHLPLLRVIVAINHY